MSFSLSGANVTLGGVPTYPTIEKIKQIVIIIISHNNDNN